MISAADFLTQTDLVAAAVQTLYGPLGGSTSVTGAYAYLVDLRTQVQSIDDDEYEMDLQGGVQGSGGMRLAVSRALAQMDAAVSLRLLLGWLVSQWDAYFAKYGTAGVSSSISEFIDTENGGATPDFTFLVAPEFALLYYLVQGGNLSVFTSAAWLTPTSVFSPLISNMGEYDIATTTFSAGDAVDTTHYAEVEPEGLVTVDIDGTAAVTVTGVNHDGTPARTWTGSADTLAAGNTFVLTPTVAGDRLREVTDIEIVGTAANGTVRVQSILERDVTT